MKLLVMGGSTSSRSMNKKMALYTASLIPNADIRLLELADFELPIYGEDLHTQIGVPAAAYRFSDEIHAADALLFSLAEHNGSYTVAFKNLMDWTSGIKDRKTFGNKPTFLTSTSAGARGAIDVLLAAEKRFPFLGAQIKGVFSLPQFNLNFEEGKGIINPELAAQLQEKLKNFIL